MVESLFSAIPEVGTNPLKSTIRRIQNGDHDIILAKFPWSFPESPFCFPRCEVVYHQLPALSIFFEFALGQRPGRAQLGLCRGQEAMTCPISRRLFGHISATPPPPSGLISSGLYWNRVRVSGKRLLLIYFGHGKTRENAGNH